MTLASVLPLSTSLKAKSLSANTFATSSLVVTVALAEVGGVLVGIMVDVSIMVLMSVLPTKSMMI